MTLRTLVGTGLASALTLLLGPALAAAQAVPPHHAYRTFDTPHFQVVYAEGLQEVALRAAAHAEEAHRILREGFLPPPSATIEILVTDHADISNGVALAAPRPRIILWARPPMDASALAQYDEWIRLVTVHEVAHIFHLDRTGTLGGVLRRVFGRVPSQWPFFPGTMLPLWAIEGVAVHLESAHTGGGRIHGTGHQAVVRAHALDGRVEGLDQALGNSPVWPGGSRPYVYGSLFFHWMEERYGPGAVAAFLEAAAGQWIPYRLNAAARKATGRSLEALWDEWVGEQADEAQAIAQAMARAAAEDAGPGGAGLAQASRAGAAGLELLTRDARTAAHPAPGPGGEVAYLRADGRSDIRLVLRDSLGGERTLTRWNSMAAPAWTAGGDLVATQLDFTSRWNLVQDVYRVTAGGGVQRLTRGGRVSHVDPHPGRGTLAAVQEGGGTNRLVLLEPDGTLQRVLREAAPGVHWAFPRWSPDGAWLAVVRWRQGGTSGIVILSSDGGGDGGDGAVGGGGVLLDDEVVLEDGSLHTAPAWSPDGRWLLWASDRTGALNIYARQVEEGTPVGTLRQATRSPAGATQPAVDRAGRWVYLSVLGATGWDLARMPFDPAAWGEPGTPRPRFVALAADTVGESVRASVGAGEGPGPRVEITGEDRPWSPLRSLLPAYWWLTGIDAQWVGGREVLPGAVGIETSGSDLVGRHRWVLHTAVPLSDPGRRPELRASWRWAGLGQPALRLVASQRYRTLGFVAPEDIPGDTLYPVVRERHLGLNAELLRQRVRSAWALTAGVAEVREDRELLEADGEVSQRFGLTRPRRVYTELRAGAGWSSVRAHSFSVSPERGASASVSVRERWERSLADSLVGVRGRDGSYREAVGVVGAFLPLPEAFPGADFARTVLAARMAGGVAGGAGAGERHFAVGGGGGGSDRPAGFTWDEVNPLFSVRGYPRGVVGGDRAWAASAELRVPLANLHRGWGALPVHLDRLAGALFADAAGAGRPEAGAGVPASGGRLWDWRGSVGAEGVLSHTFFFGGLSRSRLGVAVPLQRGVDPSVYFQAQWSF